MGWEDAPIVVAQGDAQAAELPVPARPAWERAPVFGAPERREPTEPPAFAGSLKQHFQNTAAREARSFEDYLAAGFQQSVTGLVARRKAPETMIGDETPWYGRLTANVVGMAGDLPAMIPGFVGGAAAGSAVPVVGSTIGGFAGANAAPAAIRSALMEAYTKGEVQSSSDFLTRAMTVAWETAKAGIVGAATGGAGKVASAAVPAAANAFTKAVAPTAAQIVTMTTVGRALEGQLPEPQDFLDAAIVIGGMRAASAVAGRLRRVYSATGIPPEKVVADAAIDPALKAELEGKPTERAAQIEAGPVAKQLELPGIPQAYQAIAQEETARAIVPGEKAVKVASSPFALELPQAAGEPAKPTHVNYNLINAPEDTKLAMARLSQVYKNEIEAQRRGTVHWEQTSNEAAGLLSDALGGVDTRLLMPREPGTPAGAAELLARKQLVVGAAEAMMGARDELLAKGAAATLEDQAMFLQAIERSAMIQADFLGARAEAGRALNILKSTAIEADRVKQIQQVVDTYGKNPLQLAQMLKQIDNPTGALKFAREAVKATTWEKIVEAWKAGLVSGPVTHVANIIGNTTFAALRAPIDIIAAGIGRMRGAAVGERLSAIEPLARLVGLMEGTKDGLKIGAAMLLDENYAQVPKAESFRHAIEGKKGEIIRLPFRALGAEDAVFIAMNERGEAYSLATRQAAAEGMNPLTREFRERVAQLAQNPTAEMQKQIAAAGERFTFNTALGEKGQAIQSVVRKLHLEWAVPFIRTPGNIAKELVRMTPFAPFIEEWRAAIKQGGIARDRALAEVAFGVGLSAVTIAFAMDGKISGAGEPDPGKRRAQQAAGWQPYSILIKDTWYNYQRLQPLGTLLGMAADVSEVWDHLTEEEADKVPKMLAVAFGNAITNQTFLQGITNIVNALSDPTRFGPRLAQQFAASAIPNVIGQPTAMFDPIVRQVDSITDAVKARIPGVRGELLPKRDIFGEPLQTKERLGVLSPITETQVSTDKVRTEAERLGISVADTPKKTHLGRGTGKIGEVKLEPEERDKFAEAGGKMAHSTLTSIVNAPGYDELPDLVKQHVFRNVLTASHRFAAAMALPIDKKVAYIQQITERMQQELAPQQ